MSSAKLAAAVIVPARDEADLLPRCLRALAVAIRAVGQPVELVLVLDSCTDASEAIVTRLAPDLGVRLTVLTSTAGSVGVARSAGAAHLLAAQPSDPLWLATTDADSAVCPHWLTRQLDYAAAGAQVVAGTVKVDSWTGWPQTMRRRYDRRYARPLDSGSSGGHGHIHGANLGIRADLYRELGGFPGLDTGEDVALVAAARAVGAQITWATDIAVTTSARRTGRAPLGFAAALGQLRAASPGDDA